MYKFAIVGSGRFIGDMHIKGAQFDHRAQLVCGCFSRDRVRNAATAAKYDIAHFYTDYQEMLWSEGDRLDFVIVATPNASHFEVCRACLEAGLHVVSDKPLATTGADAAYLDALAREKGLHLGVTYTFTGFPMLTQARELIRAGEIGELMTVHAAYLQDGRLQGLLDGSIYDSTWKLDPAVVGPASTLFDIGTHVDYAVRYATGLEIDQLLASCQRIPNSPPLETNASVLLRYDSGATGNYYISQVAAGCYGLRIELFGTKASLRWSTEDVQRLYLRPLDGPVREYHAGKPWNMDAAKAMHRMPAGLHEGAYEAFANLYGKFYDGIDRNDRTLYPNARDGLQGVRFVEACLASEAAGQAWSSLPEIAL